MKATINGITYEGTLDEIKAITEHMTPKIQAAPSYGELMKESSEQLMKRLKDATHSGSGQADWMQHQTKITCNYPCNCTGDCTRPRGISGIGKSLAILDTMYDRAQEVYK